MERRRLKSHASKNSKTLHEKLFPESQASVSSSRRVLMTPGLDYTQLFISLTAGAGTRCMSLLSSSPSLFTFLHKGLVMFSLLLLPANILYFFPWDSIGWLFLVINEHTARRLFLFMFLFYFHVWRSLM